MKHLILPAILLIMITGCNQPHTDYAENEGFEAFFTAPENNTRLRLFDCGWKFYKGELSGAEIPGFDESQWRKLDLPHDWSIEDLPGQEKDKIIGPFDRSSSGTFYTAFTIGGTGWYRKLFIVNEDDKSKELSIYFDGVYMESEVWLNGHKLGSHKHGYTPFHFKLNEFLNPAGKENILAVQVKNTGDNSRWYSGSGIYRHVWLRVTDPLNIPVWGVFITTPEVTEEKSKVEAIVTVENNGDSPIDFTLKNTIVSPEGEEVTVSEGREKLAPGEKREIRQVIDVDNPELWSCDTPLLYKLRSELISGDKVLDNVETTFGIRSISFSPDKGFLLNGKHVILQGACIHHDNGPLGSVAIDRADQRKIEILRKNGFNAIRTSHNPPSQGFLDACDKYGMLVMDEAFDMWINPKRADDYHLFFQEWHETDLQSMIMRDRNHPSVIMWSIGNEIKERADSSGLRIAAELIKIVKSIDTTRPVSEGICEFWETKGRKWDDSAPAYALLDVCGYNYVFGEYERDHSLYPERVIAGTESFAMDIYENWKMAMEKSYVTGDFVWTGMDYIGEAGIGQVMTDSTTMCWPWIISNCGDIDLIGNKKPQSYYRDVVWDRSPLEMEVEEIPPAGKVWKIRDWGWRRTYRSWNWPGNEGKNMNVFVYTKCNEVRIELNGRVISTQTLNDTSKFTYRFSIPYEPGELKAVALTNGKEMARSSITTTGPVKKLKISADRNSITADRNDLAYLTVELVDSEDRRVPFAENNVTFQIEGDAEIAGVGNANPMEPKSFQSTSCTAFQGRCLAILRPTGKSGTVKFTASTGDITEDYIIKIK
jgi:beta-galactosidase